MNRHDEEFGKRLADAVEHHLAGRHDAAQAAYSQLLAADPDNEEVLYLLGLLCCDLGIHAAAARFLRESIRISPGFVEARFQLGVALAAQDNRDAARAEFDRVLAAEPGHQAALTHSARLLCQRGEYAEGERRFLAALSLEPAAQEAWQGLAESYVAREDLAAAEAVCREWLAADPGCAAAVNLRGALLIKLDRYEEAAQVLTLGALAHPDQAEIWCNLGYARLQRGEYQFALSCLERAEQADPSLAPTYLNLGLLHLKCNQPQLAETQLRKALERDANLYQATNNLGLALLKQGRLQESVAHFEAVLALKPDYVEAHSNLGNAMRLLGRWDVAERCFEQALQITPRSAGLLNNLGALRQDQGRWAEARSCFERALEIVPDLHPARWNLALCQLTLGDFEPGWKNFEARWDGCNILLGAYSKPRHLEWQGEPLAGRTLLVWAEQGLGDTLQFIRYVRYLSNLGARLLLEVQPPLVELISGLPGVAHVYPAGEVAERYDLHCPLMSLPHRLGTRLETIPADVPYLFPDSAKVAAWRERLAQEPKYKVGLVWAGGARPGHPDLEAIDARRSLRLQSLAPVSEVAGVRLYSLQKGAAAAEARSPRLGFKLVDDTDELKDFSDTAALVANLDLIISVDTSVAHLAGALGRPVWMLNRHDTCWRWLLDRTDTPWYPSMRLFRQPALGDWASAVAALVAALRAVVPPPSV